MRKILVFVEKDGVSAFKIAKPINPISFNGEDNLSLKNVDEFAKCLLFDFGLNTFRDGEFEFIFVNCGAEKKSVDNLYALCHDAAKVSVVDIEKVLPPIALNMGLGKNETKVYTFDGLAWQVESHADDKTVTVKEVKATDGEKLCPADFSFLYEFRTVMQSTVEEIKKIKEECEQKLENQRAEFKSLLSGGDYENLIAGMCSHLGVDNDDQRRLTFEYRKNY